jgi:hypothetical protein
MKCAIHQPQYLPWLGYFDKMARADVFVLLDNVQFKKNEWQNRNRIATCQGWQWVTVPVLHDHGQAINEVRINPTVDWRSQHRHAIAYNYSKAPFFKEYWPRFEALYQQEWTSLAQLNIAFIQLLVNILGIDTRLVTASTLAITTERTQRLVDICRTLGCDTYIAGAGCADYMDFAVCEAAGFAVEVQDYKHPVYQQVWTGPYLEFQPYMSAVDLVMNHGGSSLDILRGIIKPSL